MAKTNAQKQKDYRERKKRESNKFLEKERNRQKKYYKKTSELTTQQLTKRRKEVKERVRRSREESKRLLKKICEQNEKSDSEKSVSPLLVNIKFPARGEQSRKRKRRRKNNLRQKIAKLTEEKRRLVLKVDSLRKKVHREKQTKSSQTPNTKITKMIREAGIDPANVPEIKKKLLFAEAVSLEFKAAGKEKRNNKKSIRTILSGKVLKKYKLLKYAASKTGTNRRKLNINSKVIVQEPRKKKGFNPEIYAKVLAFYNRDDVSTALPGKRDAKTHRKIRIQKRVLNDYLSNLHEKFKTENTDLQLSFSTFARMRPLNFILANFSNRKTCLCTYHQNFALILKMLKTHINTPTRPESFIKLTNEQILAKVKSIQNVNQFSFNVWKKVAVVYKGKHTKKMKLVTETLNPTEFYQRLLTDLNDFREHVFRISCQFKEQRKLKENLPEGHVYIHMDFAEDYKCRSQNEVQSAYWSQTQVTIHPVVIYHKNNEGKLQHKSFVFISNESRHNAVFVYALVQKLIPLIKSTVPNLQMVHCWTDSPTSQYRNKTIFKMISCHEELFGCQASWSYMESGHGKGPCDPIGGTAKRKADQAVNK